MYTFHTDCSHHIRNNSNSMMDFPSASKQPDTASVYVLHPHYTYLIFYVCVWYRSASKGVSAAAASATSQDSDSNSSDRGISAAVGSAEEGESHHDAEHDAQPSRRRKQSRQSTDSVEDGESVCSVDSSPQPLRRSSREPRQRDLSIEGSSAQRTSSSKRKKPRLSESTKPASLKEAHASTSSSSAHGPVVWTPAMVGLYTYYSWLVLFIVYYYLDCMCVMLTAGCASLRGGGAAQGTELENSSGVHGAWAECRAVPD